MGGRIKRHDDTPSIKLNIPRAGVIHIGEKRLSASGKEYPVSIDWFKASGSYASLFHAATGEKPSTIQIIFPSDDDSLVCVEQYEMRDRAGKILAEGDGETFKVWNGSERITMTTEEYPNLMSSLERKYQASWTVTLTLRFLVPAVKGIWGYWQLSTKGTASSIPQVRDAFDAFLQQYGKVAGVIFDLSVKFAKSSKPGDSSKFPVLTLIPNQSEENMAKVRSWMKPTALIGDE